MEIIFGVIENFIKIVGGIANIAIMIGVFTNCGHIGSSGPFLYFTGAAIYETVTPIFFDKGRRACVFVIGKMSWESALSMILLHLHSDLAQAYVIGNWPFFQERDRDRHLLF